MCISRGIFKKLIANTDDLSRKYIVTLNVTLMKEINYTEDNYMPDMYLSKPAYKDKYI